MDSPNNLGSRIKMLRKSLQLTQEDLGNIVELHGSSIGRIEKGLLYPTADVIMKMAIYFDVSADYLLFGKSANTQISSNPLHLDILNSIKDFTDEELIELKSHIGYMIYKRSTLGKSLPSTGQSNNEKMA